MTLTWNDLFAHGSLVSLKVSLWSATERTLARDLGIDDTNKKVTENMVLGRLRLVPKDAFVGLNAVVTEARKALKDHAQVFEPIRGAHFIADDNVAALAAKLNPLVPAFKDQVATFVSNLPLYRAKQFAALTEALTEACHNLTARDAALARLHAVYPSDTEVAEMFDMTWSLFTIQGKKGFSANLEGETAEVKSALAELIQRGRTECLERVAELSEMLKKHGKLPKRSIEPTRRLITKLRTFNFIEDPGLHEQLDALDALLNSYDNLTSDQVEVTLAVVEASLGGDVNDAIQAAEAKLAKRRLITNPLVAPATEPEPVAGAAIN